jgi:predicted signal transduction protein with EAL and GGDEF domain
VDGDLRIATMEFGTEDDATLIAAAPELLEALRGYNLIDYTALIGDALILNADPRVADYLEQLAAEIQRVRPTATQAIAQAEGKG